MVSEICDLYVGPVVGSKTMSLVKLFDREFIFDSQKCYSGYLG